MVTFLKIEISYFTIHWQLPIASRTDQIQKKSIMASHVMLICQRLLNILSKNNNSLINNFQMPTTFSNSINRESPLFKNWRDQQIKLLQYFDRSYGCPKNAIGTSPNTMTCQQHFWNCFYNKGYIQRCPNSLMYIPSTNKCESFPKIQCETELKNYIYHSNAKNSIYKSSIFNKSKNINCKNKFGLITPPLNCSKFLNCVGSKYLPRNCFGANTQSKRVCEWLQDENKPFIDHNHSVENCHSLKDETTPFLDDIFHKIEVENSIIKWDSEHEIFNMSSLNIPQQYPRYKFLLNKSKENSNIFYAQKYTDGDSKMSMELAKSKLLLDNYKKKMGLQIHRIPLKESQLNLDFIDENNSTSTNDMVFHEALKLLLHPYLRVDADNISSQHESYLQENLNWINNSNFLANEQWFPEMVNSTSDFELVENTTHNLDPYYIPEAASFVSDIGDIHINSKDIVMESLISAHGTEIECLSCGIQDICIPYSKVIVGIIRYLLFLIFFSNNKNKFRDLYLYDDIDYWCKSYHTKSVAVFQTLL